MLMEMNVGENGGARQQVQVNGGVGGRRRSKGTYELTHKKKPQRGMGVAQLERLRLQSERWKKMTEVPSLHPLPLPLPSFNSHAPNVAHQFRPLAQSSTPAMMYHGNIGIHGANLFSADHGVAPDPSVIGSSNVGLHFENSKELSSIPSYVKCVSDSCGVCHKQKKRINSGSNACWVNQFRNFSVNNTVVEMIDAGKTRRSSGQVATVHRNGGGALPEYEFFPGKDGGGAEESMKMGTTTTTTWCGSGTSVGGVIGLRGGEGSCVTAITGSEEGSVSSLDLTLKLSY